MKARRELWWIIVIPLVIVCGLVLTAAFTVYYSMTVKTVDGSVVSSRWPREFTLDFSQYINSTGSKPAISAEGEALLRENGLWLQVLDEDGAELLSYAKPVGAQASYTPYELLQTFQNGSDGYSVFVGATEAGGASYTYLVGFPLPVSKVVMYVDNARYSTGKALGIAVLVAMILLTVALIVFYSTAFSRNLDRIRASLRDVSARQHKPETRRAFLYDVYEGIDQLDNSLAAAEQQQERDEEAREEWLANIGHDLKTPLAPIRGYAELLTEGGQDPEQAQRYGQIILKDALYAEQLVDDLKLVYQLKSGMMPLVKERHDVTRFAREVVIDVLNAPEYEGRDVTFSSECDGVQCEFDDRLLRRALSNIVANALKHSGPETSVAVSLCCDEKAVRLEVADTGCGMTEQELEGLFERYWRGTSTEIKAEGSGLGMAIAKQVVEAHEGTIRATSARGAGTTIAIELPR